MAVDESRVQLARVLRFWQARGVADEAAAPADVLTIRDRFTPTSEQQISSLVGKGSLPLSSGKVWLRGPVNIEDHPPIWPIASLELAEKHGTLTMGIRVAMFSHTPSDGLRVDGWRFETAEAKGSARPFAHCQRIVSWTLDDGTLLSPAHTHEPTTDAEETAIERLRGVHQTLPAFPLSCTTLAGLALAFVVAISGRNLAQEAITGDANLQNALDDLRQDFDRLALDLH